VLSISSAFTVPTGKAHWHTLVRARAIENQCYVIASAQWGRHNEKISTFGHSLIVDPWGEILADAGEGEKIIMADLELEKIESIRARLNVLRNPKA
jgi:predicted amidohydrolase